MRQTARPGRPKDEAKGHSILEAAARCFLELGLEGASMDAIAREAGVSKLTVYNHFDSKERLFQAVILGKCGEYGATASLLDLSAEPPDKALRIIAYQFMELMMAPEVLAMHRVVIGESARNPEIARLFNEAGPRPMLSQFAELLKSFARKQALKVANPDRASDHFFSMLKGQLQMEVMLNLRPAPGKAELKRHVDDCVAVFMRAYAPEGISG